MAVVEGVERDREETKKREEVGRDDRTRHARGSNFQISSFHHHPLKRKGSEETGRRAEDLLFQNIHYF